MGKEMVWKKGDKGMADRGAVSIDQVTISNNKDL